MWDEDLTLTLPLIHQILENPLFTTYDITAVFPIADSISLFFKMTNLMNREYQEFFGYPSPGRRIEAGITYKK